MTSLQQIFLFIALFFGLGAAYTQWTNGYSQNVAYGYGLMAAALFVVLLHRQGDEETPQDATSRRLREMQGKEK
jgi:hypothetical protein